MSVHTQDTVSNVQDTTAHAISHAMRLASQGREAIDKILTKASTQPRANPMAPPSPEVQARLKEYGITIHS